MMASVHALLRRNNAGSTTIEFALTATSLLLLIVGMLEAALLFWSWQALEGAAIDAARCAAINSSSCLNVTTTTGATQTYAVSAATARGLNGIQASNVTVLTGAAAQTACGSTTANVVSVAIPYSIGPVFMAPYLSPNLTASACFPIASST